MRVRLVWRRRPESSLVFCRFDILRRGFDKAVNEFYLLSVGTCCFDGPATNTLSVAVLNSRRPSRCAGASTRVHAHAPIFIVSYRLPIKCGTRAENFVYKLLCPAMSMGCSLPGGDRTTPQSLPVTPARPCWANGCRRLLVSCLKRSCERPFSFAVA